MTIYANVVATSKYIAQRQQEPFRITLMETSHSYCWSGNGNQYRTEDLEFFVIEDGEYAPHGLLQLHGGIVDRSLESLVSWAEKHATSQNLVDQDTAYRFGQSNFFQIMERLRAIVPSEQPTCNRCREIARFCRCGNS